MKEKLILCLLSICLIQACDWLPQSEKETKVKSAESFTAQMPVIASPATLDTLTLYLYANGSLRSSQRADLINEVSGKISEIFVEENQMVEKGELLAKIEVSEQLIERKRLQLEKEKAQNELAAWQTIEPTIDQELLQLRTGLQEIEISLEKLQLQIDKASIKAPVSGTITELDYKPGMYISTGNKFATLYDLQTLFIDVRVLESEISKVSSGQQAGIRFPAQAEKIYSGKVKSIAPFIEQNSRTCQVRVAISNDGSLRAGMYAEVKIAVEKYPNKILVNKDALLIRDGKKLLFVAEAGKAKWQYVETGLQNKYLLEITKGVSPQDAIIFQGHFSLSHDANIQLQSTVPYEDFKRSF
ncbi:MAG: efflux RND transporter periplasmic adaptor subunit [Candidatus Cloacimonadales bacterium]